MASNRTIGLIGAGAMGSSLGRLFCGHGLRVLTPLESRSEATRLRAIEAGMESADFSELLGADIILSVVPPSQADEVARKVARAGAERRMPPFVDANALSPDSKRALARTISTAGGRFIDGVLIGGPPRDGYDGPRLYASGDHADEVMWLRDAGLDVRQMKGPIGTAAALKMCYGGFNKGITALATAVLLAAQRSGVGEAFVAELDASQQALLERSRLSVPHMYPKAYRWIAEFDEIANFCVEDASSSQIFRAIARFYEDRANANRNESELRNLTELLNMEAR